MEVWRQHCAVQQLFQPPEEYLQSLTYTMDFSLCQFTATSEIQVCLIP